MADLPACTGPLARCPKCGAVVLTEWHDAGGGLGPLRMKTPRREFPAPCRHRPEFALLDGEGEHLCRLCANCGCGWVEACTVGTGTEAAEIRPGHRED